MLAESHVRRFSRHVLLREVGGRGQRRLLDAVVPLSSLDEGGRACALWLARAGVGTIELPDDRSPCPSQDASGLLLARDAGRPLVEAAAERLREHFPDLVVRTGSKPGVSSAGAAGALELVRSLLEAR